MQTTRRQVLVGGTAAFAAATLVGKGAMVAAQDKTTVEWWHISTVEEQVAAFQGAADAYMADHPDVQVNITVLENEAFKQKLATAMQSGQPPDIFQSWGGGVLRQYAEAGLVREISDALATDGWGDSFFQGALDLYGQDGKYYGVPWNMGMVGFWYNKALFTQAGIEGEPATWTDFLAAVSSLKAAGIVPITVGEGDKWPGHFYWVYGAIREGGQAAFDAAYAQTGSFADPPFVAAGDLINELIALEPFQEGFLGATYPDANVLMANAQTAMELMGQWAPGTYAGGAENGVGPGDDLGFFGFPTIDDGAGLPTDVLGGGDGYALGVNASDAAVDFVRYLTNVDNQKNIVVGVVNSLPVVAAAEEAVTDPNLKLVLEKRNAATYVQLYYDQFLPPAVGGVVNDSVQGLFAGTLTSEQVAQAIQDSAATELAAS